MSGDTKRYWGNVLASLDMGMQMDWRVRFAMDLLREQGGALMDHTLESFLNLPAETRPEENAARAAAFTVTTALTMAEELIKQAGVRGWVKDLPDSNEIDDRLRKHIERNVRAAIFQQVAQSKIAPSEVPPQLMHAVGGLPPFDRQQ
jgi:hypothetical protein